MADYNIYIRTIGGEGGEGSAVKPFQTGGGDGGEGFSASQASQFVSKTGAFLENPDSGIGMAKNAAVGTVSRALPWVGVAILAATIVAKIGLSITDKYFSYASSATGDYQDAIAYSNIKQSLSNAFSPFSTAIRIQMKNLEIRKTNERLRQEQLLTGGTILNSQYGRYL